MCWPSNRRLETYAGCIRALSMLYACQVNALVLLFFSYRCVQSNVIKTLASWLARTLSTLVILYVTSNRHCFVLWLNVWIYITYQKDFRLPVNSHYCYVLFVSCIIAFSLGLLQFCPICRHFTFL